MSKQKIRLKIWTIGYGGRGVEDFINKLKENGIDVVVDVRRWPTSKVIEYRRENLKRILKEHGIEYVWLGEELGGYRRGGYERYMQSESFKKGIERLMKLAHDHRVCIMCLERSPRGCHRRFIAKRLEELGVEVCHIV
ncbi:MAG: DUF488 domain-containing protein [Thermoprotei archaeon]|nr:MAG: DUF488 domain-containing protein [Thermoprotei archaeon]RLF24161.1 MAG: DUF488 domain-containing protein [Thermoprotei archaeon]